MGDLGHTQNVQINKVIGENEKCVFYYGKNHMDFLDNPILKKKPTTLSVFYRNMHAVRNILYLQNLIVTLTGNKHITKPTNWKL